MNVNFSSRTKIGSVPMEDSMGHSAAKQPVNGQSALAKELTFSYQSIETHWKIVQWTFLFQNLNLFSFVHNEGFDVSLSGKTAGKQSISSCKGANLFLSINWNSLKNCLMNFSFPKSQFVFICLQYFFKQNFESADFCTNFGLNHVKPKICNWKQTNIWSDHKM